MSHDVLYVNDLRFVTVIEYPSGRLSRGHCRC